MAEARRWSEKGLQVNSTQFLLFSTAFRILIEKLIAQTLKLQVTEAGERLNRGSERDLSEKQLQQQQQQKKTIMELSTLTIN